MVMATTTVWITTIISAVLVLIAGHITITIILPKLKDFLKPAIKDDNALASLMIMLIILVAVLALKAEVTLLLTLQNNTVNLINVLSPGLDLILGFSKYLGYLVLGFLVILGLKFYK